MLIVLNSLFSPHVNMLARERELAHARAYLRAVNVIETGAIRKLGCTFVFAFYSNCGRICLVQTPNRVECLYRRRYRICGHWAISLFGLVFRGDFRRVRLDSANR